MSYTFYFEVNKNNIGEICNYIKHETSWNGFSLGNTNITDFPNYLDSNLTLHNNNIDFSDLNIPENTFIIDWNDVNGVSNINTGGKTYKVKCSGESCKTWYPPNDILTKSNLSGSTMYYPQEVNNQPYVQGTSNVFNGKGVNWNTYKQSVEYLRNPRYKLGPGNTIVNTESTGFKYDDWVYNTTIPWNYPYSIQFGQLNGGSVSNPGYNIKPTAKQSGQFPNVMNGNVNYFYKVYKPISYTNKPTVKKNLYFPPINFKGGFYNYGFFIGNLELVSNNTTQVNLPCSTSISNKNNKNSNTNNYAIYEVRYNIPVSSFSKPDFFNQLQDFLYLQTYLFNKSSSTFKLSNEWKITSSNIEQLIMDFCNYSGDMELSICNGGKNNFPFTTILPAGSPCIYSSGCIKGWNKHCFTGNNISSSLCNNYYSSEYVGEPDNNENRLLNDSIVYNLEKKCQKDFLSTKSPETDLSQDWWNTCACFLPNEYYNEILEKNNMIGKSIGDQSCWFLPCQINGLKRQTNASCPNNNVATCIQNSYITYGSTNPTSTLKDNIIHMNQTIATCGKPVQEAEPVLDASSSGVGSLFPSVQTSTIDDITSTPIDDISTTSQPIMIEETTTPQVISSKRYYIIGGSVGGVVLLTIIIIIIIKQ